MINEEDVIFLIEKDTWMMDVLKYAKSLNLPDWWICAGFVRSKIWDTVHGFKEKTSLPDVDVIYFDAFASSNQPEMWSKEFITHIISFLKPGGVFVTYAITGDLKRIMKSLGMAIEKAPGAAGKREMLRAVKS